jgi:long-chain acyl-CoA synthetase
MGLPVEVQAQFERVSGTLLVEGYGLTESSPSTHCNPLSDRRRPGTIGLPLPGTACRVVDVDDPTREVPVGTAGELLVKGPQVFRGYWGASDTAGVLTDDGYLLTGDIAVMDADGFFRVVDRKKDIIVSGGFNTSPSEVEAVLRALSGVREAVVVGVPDRHRGEVVKAYVVAPGGGLTEADVIAHCAEHLTGYKVPRSVEFRDALPHSAVGKVLRRELLEEERSRNQLSGDARKSEPPGGRSSPT